MCSYLDEETGKKCAVGKWLKEGTWQKFRGDVSNLNEQYILKNILLKKAKDMNFEIEIWKNMQDYHDEIATGFRLNANYAVKNLEEVLDINLTELKIK